MGGMTRELPAVESKAALPDYDHLYHCDPNIALCGADLTNIDWRCPAYGCDHPWCPLCALVLESGCCPLC